MFHNGDLQSGIAQALSESRSVACFVRDDSEQSLLWENDFLTDNEVSSALSAKAIILRLNADSKEAGYLSAYYPVPAVPALLILHNGRALLCLGAGLEKQQFKRSILQTLDKLLSPSENSDHFASEPTVDSASSSGSTLAEPEENLTSSVDGYVYPQPAANPQASSSARGPSTSARAVSSATSAQQSSSSSRIQQMLAERRERLEKGKREKEAAESEIEDDQDNAARTNDEGAEEKTHHGSQIPRNNVQPKPKKAMQAQYAQQERKRKQEVQANRERILREIENNKAERKAKEEERKALARAQAGEGDGAGGLVNEQLAREQSQPQQKNYNECALQVRLFDGGTVRQRFPADQSLGSHVRPWIEERKLNGGSPFTFKQILTPMPNRIISEEYESLHSLGLTPSATLVIVPIKGYATAYAEGQKTPSRYFFAVYSWIISVLGLIAGALRTFLGIRRDVRARSEQEPPVTVEKGHLSQQGVVDAKSRTNMRTLRDQREDQDDHQLYNGNQLNFEPRKKEDDEEE